MATGLDPGSIEVIAGAFMELFAKLVRGHPPTRFLEVLCGFVYAVQKTKRILELTEVLTAKELSEIDKLLADAAGTDMGLHKTTQCAKGEEE